MKVQRYTPNGKWSKPFIEGNGIRLSGSINSHTKEPINCTLKTEDGGLITISKSEYDELKYFFEREGVYKKD